MTSAKQTRLRIGLLVAIAAGALSFGLEGAGKQARSDEAARPATPKPRPIPEAGPLAQPKSLQQVGLPADATRAAIPPDNPQTPEKIALGEQLVFDGAAHRLTGPLRAGTPLSTGAAPNDLWCADFKGEFNLGNGRYCFRLAVSNPTARTEQLAATGPLR